jgi:hypothetical protein
MDTVNTEILIPLCSIRDRQPIPSPGRVSGKGRGLRGSELIPNALGDLRVVPTIVVTLLRAWLDLTPERGGPANHRNGGRRSTALLTPLLGLYIVAVDGDGGHGHGQLLQWLSVLLP